MDQDILLGFDFAVRAIGLVVAPLGTVLIGAGLVMAHITGLITNSARDRSGLGGDETAHSSSKDL